MKVTVIGTGYVGLVSGTCLADVGHNVLCLDIDSDKIRMLNDGGIPIHERGLPEIVQRNLVAGRLRFTTNIEESVSWAQIQVICVGTPTDKDGSADLQYVMNTASNIAKQMTEYKVIVNKSTVPVGTADKVHKVIAETLLIRNLNVPFTVVSNPEFLKEGEAVEDFMRPDRIIIGTEDKHAEQLMRELYAPFNRNHERVICMNTRSAELTKYAANCMLATRISFMNELANLANKLGVDIEQVRLGIGADPRIGYDFLYPGCGYGGSCFPKDIRALIHTAFSVNQPMKILTAVQEVNDAQKRILLEKIQAKFGTDLIGKNFALWGLAFKPNTDDMREAASCIVIHGLLEMRATVTAYDPVAMSEAKRIFGINGSLTYADSPISTLINADALIIVTEWKEFRAVDLTKIKTALKTPVIFDGRNLYSPHHTKAVGLEYFSIGRGA